MAQVQMFGKEIKNQMVEAVEEGTPTHLSPSLEKNLAFSFEALQFVFLSHYNQMPE